jgi:hypothetical protein
MRLIFAGFLACAVSAGAAHGQVVIGLDDAAQVLRNYNPATGEFSDLSTPGFGIRGLTADNAGRVFYATTGAQLWRIPFDAPDTPVLVGTFNGAVASISGGLAFAANDNTLYATTTSSMYSVDTGTATTTLVRAFGGGDFGGIDYNADDGKIYMTNDSTSTVSGLTGTGIYRLDPPYATGTLVEIAPYPTGTTADFDGLSVGGGFVYALRDLDNNLTYRLSLSTLAYDPPITRPGGTTTSEVFVGGAYAPSLGVLPPGANIGVAISGDAPCTIPLNGTATFNLTVSNIGPETATNVVLTITTPANADMINANPAGTQVGNTLTINLPSIAASSSTPVTVTLRPISGTDVSLSASVTAAEPDAALSNNAASNTVTLAPQLPTTAAIKGIFTTLAAASTSEVPGIDGARFATGAIAGRPFASPDGSRFIQSWDTDLDTATDQILVVVTNGVPSVVAREGVTALPTQQGTDTVGPPYFPMGAFDAVYGINNAGQFTFAGIDSRSGTADDGYVVKWNGTQLALVAQENINPPAPPVGINYGATNESPQIASDGTVAFTHTVTGLTTDTDEITVKNDGATLVYQEGVTVWGSQAGGTAYDTDDLDAGTVDGGIFFNADHTRYIAGGLLNSLATTDDDVVVVDGNVVLQEGVIIPGSGFSSPPDQATPYTAIWMQPDGTWFIRGDNDDGQDWVLRNGAVVASSLNPIHTGAAEMFSDATYADTFFLSIGNTSGDYVVGGTTDSTNLLANAVVVLNNSTVVARENDPVDLDNDGTFDDNVFIRTFIDDRTFMTADALYLVVRLRDTNAAYCGGADTDIGQALIRIDLPSDCVADINNSGTVTVQDIFDFLAFYFTGNQAADVNNSGTVTVQDIFDFLALYFIGCP